MFAHIQFPLWIKPNWGVRSTASHAALSPAKAGTTDAPDRSHGNFERCLVGADGPEVQRIEREGEFDKLRAAVTHSII